MDTSLFAGLCFHGRSCAVLSKDGIEECWNIVDNIRAGAEKGWVATDHLSIRSWSPEEAGMLLGKDGFTWSLR